jgi:RNA polymerase sigma factor (sigma-70 family)
MTDWPAIVSTHESLLWRTAYRILNHRDDALDCCQQALLDAYEYGCNRTVDDWRALLTSVVTRRSIDRLRQRRRALRTVVALDQVAEPLAKTACPEQRTTELELMERLRSALTALPCKQAEVFWLSSVEQLSHEDISRQLAITQNESRVLLHRARLRLASLLDGTPSAIGRTP